jgi:1L-myo-inositol 1-phosphate cytidylyltransferase
MTFSNNKTGIILAAGIGSRLSESGIKPLLDIQKKGLLIRTIRSHAVARCEKIIIVLGCHATTIKEYVLSNYKGNIQIEFVYNENYQLQNGISLLCARGHAEGKFLLTMSDHILDDKIMYSASQCNPPNSGATLCVDYKLDTIFDMQDATKVMARDEKIVKIGKQLNDYNCVDTGVFHRHPRFVRCLADPV